MVHGAEESLRHVMRIVEKRALISINGKVSRSIRKASLCMADNADAVATARTIREGLLKAGYQLVTIPELFV